MGLTPNSAGEKKGQHSFFTIKKKNSYLFALNKTSGRLSKNAIHWPERRNNKVRNACAAFSGRTN